MRTLCWGSEPVGVRRLRSLLFGLPRDAAVWREPIPRPGPPAGKKAVSPAALARALTGGN